MLRIEGSLWKKSLVRGDFYTLNLNSTTFRSQITFRYPGHRIGAEARLPRPYKASVRLHLRWDQVSILNRPEQPGRFTGHYPAGRVRDHHYSIPAPFRSWAPKKMSLQNPGRLKVLEVAPGPIINRTSAIEPAIGLTGGHWRPRTPILR